MNKLKLIGMTGLAAAAVGLGGLAAAPSASALPRQPRESCQELDYWAVYFDKLGDFWRFHDRARANEYYEVSNHYASLYLTWC